MRRIYPSVSLTHVKTEQEKDMIRAFIRWLETTFDAEVVRWAFDLEAWRPLPCDNIYKFDNEGMDGADLMIVVYLSSDGSDGRGGEVVRRAEQGGALLSFKRRGVKVSRYVLDCLKEKGIDTVEFDDFRDMEPFIAHAFAKMETAV